MIPRANNFQAFANRDSSANLAPQPMFEESHLVDYCKFKVLARIPVAAVVDFAR